MNRREFVSGAGLALSAFLWTPAFAQLKPFGLRVVRQSGWEEMMGRSLCIASKIYTTDPEDLVCFGLELPYRNNMKYVSAVPDGTYEAFARASKKNGAVIQLKGVPNRTAIQFHTGEWVSDTEGCIIFGSEAVTSKATPQDTPPAYIEKTKGCWIDGSKAARAKVLDLYGWTDRSKAPPKRPILVTFESE